MRERKRRSRRPRRGRGHFEQLEDRRLLASDWQNPGQALDTTADLVVSPLDALVGINRLNQLGSTSLGAREPGSEAPFFDANGDGSHSPIDVLVVINPLNDQSTLLAAQLDNDTAPNETTNDDRITSDPQLTVAVALGEAVSLRGSLSENDANNFVPVPLSTGTRFTLDISTLEAVNGGPLDDGPHTLRLQPQGASEPTEVLEFSFTLDRQAPSATVDIDDVVRETFDRFEVAFDEVLAPVAPDTDSFELAFDGGARDGELVPISSVTSQGSSAFQLNLSERLSDDSYQFALAASFADAAGNEATPFATRFTVSDPTGVVQVSPANGEDMVNVTRETIIRFDERIDPATIDPDPTDPNDDAIVIMANSEPVRGRLRVSSTERFATFYYDEPLPASTEVRITVDGDQIIGRDGLALDVDGDNEPGGFLQTDFRTLSLTQIPGTELFGFVKDSQTREPIAGVEISLEAFPEISAVTDSKGFFELGTQDLNEDGISDGLPAPDFFVHIDGSPASTSDGRKYASLGKPFHSTPGQRDQLNMAGEAFDIFLPPIADDAAVSIVAGEDTEVSFGESDLAMLAEMFPDAEPALFESMQVMIPDGSAINDAGAAATEALVVPVDPNFLPAPLPPHLDPSLVVSIQTPGATNFDVPAAVTFPNLDGLAAGEKSLIFSFDHDAGRFVVNGSGTVSADGTRVVSDPGVGINAPGWHFQASGTEPSPPRDGGENDCDAFGWGDVWTLVKALGGAIKDVFRVGPLISAGFEAVAGLGDVITQVEAAREALAQGNDREALLQTVLALNTNKTTAVKTISALKDAGSPLSRGLAVAKAALDLGNTALKLGTKCSEGTEKLLVEIASRLIRTASQVIGSFDDLQKAITDVPFAALGLGCQVIDDILNDLLTESSSRIVGEGEGPSDAELLQSLSDAAAHLRTFKSAFDEAAEPIIPGLASLESSLAELNQLAVQPILLNLGAARNGFYRFSLPNFEVRGRTSADGAYNLPASLPSETPYTFEFYDVTQNAVGELSGITSSSGVPTQLVAQEFEIISLEGADDTDGEGLADRAEAIVGTSSDKADTDDDGVSDLAELLQGLDPLGGRAFPTGVIASLPLPGEPTAIAVAGTPEDPGSLRAFIATGRRGLSIVDATQFNNPIVLGQIDLDGDATDVSVDARLGLAAVATGSGGLQIVDISDGSAPALQRIVRGAYKHVESLGGIAYASEGGTLARIDLATGQVLSETVLTPTASITGMTRDGGKIYTMNREGTLTVVDVSSPTVQVRGSLSIPGAGGQLFAGNEIVYAAASATTLGGFATADVSDPDNPILISGTDAPVQSAPGTAIVTNGSGTGLLIGQAMRTSGDPASATLLDVSDPNNTYEFLGRIDLASPPTSVAVAGGVAFVTDESSLQVLNYLPFDNQGEAPTVSLAVDTDSLDTDPNEAGTQVPEGAPIPISTSTADDVQVRNVELVVDGSVVQNALSFPFNLAAVAPALPVGVDSRQLQIEVRATDTGGNVANSAQLAIEIVPDSIAPVIDMFDVDLVDVAPDTPGTQVLENTDLVAEFAVADAGVTSVRLVRNEQVVATQERSFGSLRFTTDPLEDGQSSRLVDIHLLAADLAGNETTSAPVQLEVVPDMFPPRIQEINLAADDARPLGPLVLQIRFDEPIDSATVSQNTFQLTDADNELVSPESLILFGDDDFVRVGYVLASSGRHRLTIAAPTIADRAGNALGDEPLAIDFSARDGSGPLFPGQKFAVGQNPNSITTADFNRDGITDIASANSGSGDVSVLLGVGDGTFAVEQRFDTGSSTSSSAAADFNGDGITDLAAANPASDDISILLGVGDGTFLPEQRIAVGDFAHTVRTGDLNGDGSADLLVAFTGGNVAVFLGGGDGTFGDPNIVDAGSFVSTLEIGDFNGDQVVDIAAGNDNTPPNVAVLLGLGDGTFGGPNLFFPPGGAAGLAAGDFNGDGVTDIATGGPNSFLLTVLRGLGDGSFNTLSIEDTGQFISSVAAGDFDGDGTLDLAASHSGTDEISVRYGEGDGTFTNRQPHPAGEQVGSLAVGDFDGDGVVDLATANRGSGDVTVLPSNGDGSFDTPQRFDAGDAGAVAIGDFNNDGIEDVVTANERDDDVSVLLGVGDGTFLPQQRFFVGDKPHSVAVGDFDGDGNADVATANIFSGDLSVLLGLGDGTFAPQRRFAAGSSVFSVTTGDFNQDGILDLAADGRIDDLSVFLGIGDGSFAPRESFGAGEFPNSIASADFNADGIADLVVTNEVSDDVSVLLGIGDGTFESERRFIVGDTPVSIAVGDFDGNGTLDLATVNQRSDDVSVLLGVGDGTFSEQQRIDVGDVFSSPDTLAIGDFNGDEILDLSVVRSASADVVVLLGLGDGTFDAGQRFVAGSSPRALTTGDFNQDGATDLVAANSSDVVTVLLNQSSVVRQTLRVADTQAVEADPNAPTITVMAATDSLQAAVQGWISLGVASEQFSNFRLLTADLPGNQLGAAAVDTIWLDKNAAGYGWFIDPTLQSDEEFERVADELRAKEGEASGRIDLLTVLAHELGHLLGLADTFASDRGLMHHELGLGIRRSPSAEDVDALFALSPDTFR